MNRLITIYALADDNGVRYVGKTAQWVENRLISHKSKSLRHQKTPKEKWLATLYGGGQEPETIILEKVLAAEASKAEREWVAYFRGLGCDLVNSAVAGSGATFRRKIDWSEYEHLLGQIPDEALGEEVGVTRKAVAYQRQKRGIPPRGNREELRSPPPAMGGWNRIPCPEEIVPLLGTISDSKLGKKFGVSKPTVGRWRRKRGIPSWDEQNGYPSRFDGQGSHPYWGR